MFCCDIESDMNVAEQGLHFKKVDKLVTPVRTPHLVDARTHDPCPGIEIA